MMRFTALSIGALAFLSLGSPQTADDIQASHITETSTTPYSIAGLNISPSLARQLAMTEQNVPAEMVSSEMQVEEPAPREPVFITVVEGDSLTKIAEAHNTTYKRLFDANTFITNPDIVNPGEQIRIPFEDEELTERELPKPAPAPESVAVNRIAPAPARAIASSAPAVAGGSVWDRLAACESGGNWSINTGNGYYGGLQFSLSTWQAVGGQGYPHQNPREEQILRGEILLARSGWGQWPQCAAKLGLL